MNTEDILEVSRAFVFAIRGCSRAILTFKSKLWRRAQESALHQTQDPFETLAQEVACFDELESKLGGVGRIWNPIPSLTSDNAA